MKLLLNMNVLPQLGPRLAAAGHPCRHACDIGLQRAEDPAIIDAAVRIRLLPIVRSE